MHFIVLIFVQLFGGSHFDVSSKVRPKHHTQVMQCQSNDNSSSPAHTTIIIISFITTTIILLLTPLSTSLLTSSSSSSHSLSTSSFFPIVPWCKHIALIIQINYSYLKFVVIFEHEPLFREIIRLSGKQM